MGVVARAGVGVKHPVRWTLKWVGNETHVLWNDTKPLLFRTRTEARAWATEHYGYIRRRPDLRRAPHNWRMPKPVQVDVILRERKAP